MASRISRTGNALSRSRNRSATLDIGHRMQLSMYQVDAFASHVFGGNPAAVVPLTEWLPDAVMQDIAAENNLSETVYFIPRGPDYDIRWFTPVAEIDLAGHPTLAAA